MLHNDKAVFEETILKTSEYLGVKVEIVEKDYYVRVIILSRLKDGHSTQKRICKDLFFGSFESLKETMPDIIKVAEEYYARVYIDTVSKRLSSGFLSQIEWERFKVFGIKPQLKDIIINEDFYGLYDADEYSENANKIVASISKELNFTPLIIKSSNKGEHWFCLLYTSDAADE